MISMYLNLAKVDNLAKNHWLNRNLFYENPKILHPVLFDLMNKAFPGPRTANIINHLLFSRLMTITVLNIIFSEYSVTLLI